ncbi:MAG: formamidopyrimidine-DNA glycosylase, partial [Acidobacteria bacterium]|nr:formamidopyrimidine-DNA glycosylase [Acidobacteriota bacterium]
LKEAEGRVVVGVRRLGKRVVLCLEGDLFLSIHLMIAGRFRWGARAAKLPGRVGQAAFDFEHGTLLLTEAGSKRRAAMHLVAGEEGLASLDRGGLEVLECGLEAFRARLTAENHTLKRALIDPRLFSGIGNAYSDEILHRARLSPMRWTTRLNEEQIDDLYRAAMSVLSEWTDRLRDQAGGRFPAKVTAFHDDMAVHGRYRKPCPACGAPVQRIVYAENECNYCARCQTGGRLLADRALSRLLKADWPRTVEELEERLGPGGAATR